MGENRLIRLALDSSRITGKLAERYVLAKLTDGVIGKVLFPQGACTRDEDTCGMLHPVSAGAPLFFPCT